MTLVLNLRGANGSGKSTAARSLVAGAGETWTFAGVPCLVDPAASVCLIGGYPEGKTGGCDRVKTHELMRAAIEVAAASFKVVVFESVTVSTVFGSWAWFCRHRVPFWWVYLDTPYDVCVARVEERNGGKPFNRKMVLDKCKAIARTREKAINAGFSVWDVNYQVAIDQVRNLTLLA